MIESSHTSPSAGWAARRLAELHLAAVFLTRLPLPHLRPPLPALSAALWAFPLVGAGIGLAGGAVLMLASAVGLPGPLAAGLALLATVLLTGALHEDGLADIADGFGGGATRARKLEILRDSRVGSYGVVALLLVVGLRWQALASLASSPLSAALVLTAAHALARASVPWAMVLGRPARSDGLGAAAGEASLVIALITLAVGMIVAVGLVPALALPMAGLMLAITTGIGWVATRQIGGYTGDVLGAIVLLSETAALMAATR